MTGPWGDDTLTVEPRTDGVEISRPLPDGIHNDVSFERYIRLDRVHKSGLWTMHSRSPAHARAVKEESNAMKIGTAIHCAVLEPDFFRSRFHRGPEDRRGNRWKLLQHEWGEQLLTMEEYDSALALRDAVKDHPYIRRLTGNGSRREVTACATDPATGLATCMRADAYTPGDGILCDLKSTADARKPAFLRRVVDFGYHVQEAHYGKTWKLAGGDYKAFVFVVVEPEPPYAMKIYELDADAVAEGEAIREKAMARWAECVETGKWPGYDDEPEVLSLKKYDYTETTPING